MTRNLTSGNPMKLVISFAAPLLFGVLFQQLYSFVDMFEMIARTAVALLLVPAIGFTGACFANPAAWTLADLFLFPCYFHIMRSLRGKVVPA